jgi:hypothetical protein
MGTRCTVAIENPSTFGAGIRQRAMLGRNVHCREWIPTDRARYCFRQDKLAAIRTPDQRVYLETAVRADMRFVANLRIALRT